MTIHPAPTLTVGFDSHPASHGALRFAGTLAARLGAHVHVVHVVDTDDVPVDPDSGGWNDAVGRVVARDRLDADAILADDAAPHTFHVRTGDPAAALIAVADDTDSTMILIGTPRRDLMSRIDRLLGESVSARLVHRGRRPVVFVPAAADPDEP